MFQHFDNKESSVKYLICIVVSMVRDTLLGLIINVYCNECPRDEGNWYITDFKASANTMGNLMNDMLSVSVME